jgi:integrase
MSPLAPAPAPSPVPETHQSVLSYSPTLTKQQHRVNIDTKTLLKIEEVKLHLEAKGKSLNTLDGFERHIKQLAQRANLDIPQDVELAIARYKLIDRNTWKPSNQPASNTYKQKLCDMYNHYCKFYKIPWEMPKYTPEERGIQPPSDEKCLMLIAASKGSLSLKIDISTQTGLRPIEVQGYKGLKVKDIHFDQKTITALSVKKCNARPPMKITEELAARLKTYITKNNLQAEDFLFKGNERRYGEKYRRLRNRLAKKLNDPTIKAIRLYDLRHAYVTKQLKRCQNAEIVRQIVGHRHLNTTQKYMHLLAGTNGEWIVEGTTDKERAKQLLASDFTYQLTSPDGYMMFRKPK